VFLAIELAMEKKENAEELWEKISKDQYMACAVKEVYESVKFLLSDLLLDEDMHW
jgi:callose synthase